MIVPLREAYENYERMRLEEEDVKAAEADSPETSTADKGLESSSTYGKIFREKKASKQANKEQEKLTLSSIKSQLLTQDRYFVNIVGGEGGVG